MKRSLRSLACGLLALTAFPVQTNKAMPSFGKVLAYGGIAVGVLALVVTTVQASLYKKYKRKPKTPDHIPVDTSKRNDTAPRWDWSEIDVSDTPFTEVTNGNFLKMASTSAHQVEGGQCNNWTEWEKEKVGTVCHEHSGKACNLWNLENFETMVSKLKEMGMNTYRFSIEWSRIQPDGPDSWNWQAIKQYREMFRILKHYEVKAVVSLHHFTNPIWFQELGGFTKQKNNPHFVAFCTKMYREFGNDVHIWFTFNEPVGHAFLGYRADKKVGDTRFPHACSEKQLGLGMARRVLSNQLKAHVSAYRAMKIVAREANKEVAIGIGKNFCQMRPNSCNPLRHDMLITFIANKIANKSFLNFLKKHSNTVDVIGMNYYAHRYFDGTEQAHKAYEIRTDMDRYSICPEGLYYAIMEAAKFGKPILINECGIADDGQKEFDLPEDHSFYRFVDQNIATQENGDWRRDLFYKLYYKSLYEAMQTLKEKNSNAEILGLGHWSAVDNFEWDEGYSKKFGLCSYELDANDELTLTIKPGARYTQQVMNSF